MTGMMLAESMDAIEHLKNLTDPNFIPTVEIYTDGACSGNPGPGGWGAVILYQSLETDLSGGDLSTTNNRMEMMAAIKAIQALPRRCKVNLYTDSMYVRDGITRWMAKWKQNGWKTADKKPVKNQDLWLELDAMLAHQDIVWHWVKGHDGLELNERADALARQAIIAQRMSMEN